MEARAGQTESELELCRTDVERGAVLLEQYKFYREHWRQTKVLVDAGTKPEQDLQHVEYYRWNAKLQLWALELATAK